MMRTTTLYNYIQSELIKKGLNEFVNDKGSLVVFNEDDQFMTKILKYDEDVSKIVDHLFSYESLDKDEHDDHFKKIFIYRFINRQINRQTIEAFKLELLHVFLSSKSYINRIYEDVELFITQSSIHDQENKQLTDGSTLSDNRSAFADLPQSTANLDVDNTNMSYETDNTISRNRQNNQQETDGTTKSNTKSYSFDELFKSNGLMGQVLDNFDIKCFLQIW